LITLCQQIAQIKQSLKPALTVAPSIVPHVNGLPHMQIQVRFCCIRRIRRHRRKCLFRLPSIAGTPACARALNRPRKRNRIRLRPLRPDRCQHLRHLGSRNRRTHRRRQRIAVHVTQPQILSARQPRIERRLHPGCRISRPCHVDQSTRRIVNPISRRYTRALPSQDESPRQPPTAPSRQSPDPGGSPASIPCPRRCPGQNPPAPAIRGCWPASLPPRRDALAALAKVPSCPVAIRRAFSFGAAPEPSETTTSGPSSSQRSSGRLAAERSVQASSRPAAHCRRAAPRAATASLHRGCSGSG
jgi:hypothetical protein